MNLRTRMGLNTAPLFVRVLLATIFLLAGLGKLMTSFTPTAEQIPALVAMGAIPAQPPATVVPPPPSATTPPPAGAETPPSASPAAAATPNVQLPRLYMLAMGLVNYANPQPGEDGTTPMSLWPKSLASGSWPMYAAWAVGLTEAVGGACVLIGLLTRFWAFSLAVVMITAMWLTEIGPAVQSGKTMMGFLPQREVFGGEWMHMQLQFAMLMSALALMFLGAGRLSVDRLLFGARDADEE